MKKNIIYCILPACMLALMPFGASAQDINSTVEVRKAYEGKLHEVHKPQMKMNVPDSLTRFDLAFDYDRFQSRYTSSYEFHPHLLDLKPNAQIDNGNKFYMKVGAGYTLHPYLDLVWSPVLKHNWKMNIYASHHSYVGNYHDILGFALPPVPPAIPTTDESVNDLTKHKEGDRFLKYAGYDLLTTAGLDARHDWRNTVLTIDTDYYGLAQKDWMKVRDYNAVDAGLRFYSKSVRPDRFHYDISADYRFATDHVGFNSGYHPRFEELATGPSWLQEHDFSADAVIGPVLKNKHKILFDFAFDGAAYTGAIRSFVGNVSVSARYIYERGRWDIAAGVRAEKVIRNSRSDAALHGSKEQIVYPDVNISFTAVKNGMDIYLRAVGGNDINTYSSILDKHHFADFTFGRGMWPALDNNVDRVRAAFGFRGRITPYFSYDLSGGYENHASALMDAVVMDSSIGMLPALAYTSYHNAFAAWDLRFDSGAVAATLAGKYNYTAFLGAAEGIFKPSAVEAYANVTYNWHKRIYAGIDCTFASGRRAQLGQDQYRMKAYADLGLYLEYKHTSRLSFWAKGGNLLFQTIQRHPGYAERGGNFTVGICLNM